MKKVKRVFIVLALAFLGQCVAVRINTDNGDTDHNKNSEILPLQTKPLIEINTNEADTTKKQ